MGRVGERSQHVFIVRLWWEQDSTGSRQRRGSVEHVASGMRLYFTSLRDLNDFVDQRSREPLPAVENEQESVDPTT